MIVKVRGETLYQNLSKLAFLLRYFFQVAKFLKAQQSKCLFPFQAFSTALAFYDGYRSAKLPANLIQVNLIDVTQSKFSYHISPTIIEFVTRTLNTF